MVRNVGMLLEVSLVLMAPFDMCVDTFVRLVRLLGWVMCVIVMARVNW